MPEYTSIRVRKETKKLLEGAHFELESRLGRRLDYDELLRILARGVYAKPELLRRLLATPVEEHDSVKV